MKELVGKIVKYELTKAAPSDSVVEEVIITDVKLPTDSPAKMKTLRAEGKKWYVTIVYDSETDNPFALFCTTNHREKTAPVSDAVERLIYLAEAKGILAEHINKLKDKITHDNNVNKLTRTISLLLRHRVSIPNIVNALDKVETVSAGSFLFHIKKLLATYIKDGQEVEGAVCLECGGKTVYSEGCAVCIDCGSSKCG